MYIMSTYLYIALFPNLPFTKEIAIHLSQTYRFLSNLQFIQVKPKQSA